MINRKYGLKVCTQCSWIYVDTKCPVCGSELCNGAYKVYSGAAYRYANTQKPYIDQILAVRRDKLEVYVAEVMKEME